VSKSVGQDLVVDTFVSLSWSLRGVENAVNVVLDTSTAWSLPVALDFSVSAANAGLGRSAGDAGGRRNRSRHNI
jgi:hypothetical protein